MKSDLPAESFQDLFEHLETVRQEQAGSEYWPAHEIQQLLSFEEQHTFFDLMKQAKAITEESDHDVDSHFVEGDRSKSGHALFTRYACHLIVRNSDATEQQVVFAQNYFLSQNRKLDIIVQRMRDVERIEARKRLAQTEKRLSGVVHERGIVGGKAIAVLRNLGDGVLFGGKNTKQMKQALGVPTNRPLADFLPTSIIEAKERAAELTEESIDTYNLRDKRRIENAHIESNKKVRTELYHKGIQPEYQRAEDDAEKVQRRLASDERALLKES